ncbi:uncharacterized protein CIMG_13610 [Coccidioides immitis RS]|uniref:Uncharacterized protein n=1 Tax=Coccidioides immitis (strain RS) TaxID=246410 RepID=A0A0D8JVP2_COCIM|nr:uncharacterized protein CIMG_13610 [Coccidioides immitis RS]KJF61377.1 hypothetical protein CIMG_13610 [Coccidioides immitis RS]
MGDDERRVQQLCSPTTPTSTNRNAEGKGGGRRVKEREEGKRTTEQAKKIKQNKIKKAIRTGCQ